MFSHRDDTTPYDELVEKWNPLLEHDSLEPISDYYKKKVTAVLLENQQTALREQAINEQANVMGGNFSNPQVGSAGNLAGYDPVLISLVRRSMPNLMAYDLCGVQPMTAPTGLIFALRAKYSTQQGFEAGVQEALPFAGASAGAGPGALSGYTNDDLNTGLSFTAFNNGTRQTGLTFANGDFRGMSTANAETLGSGSLTFQEMAFDIDRIAVEAKTKALKAEYTTELAQDLKAVHGLDAETELANILSTEILTEINREVVRTIYRNAKLGAQQPDLFHKGNTATVSALGGATAIGGIYDLERDSDGRWSAERFRGLIYQIEREANVIAKETRRGKGNIVLCTSDVASALAMSGFLNLTPNPQVPGYADDTANTYIGTLNGNIKVYIDPYSISGSDYCVVGYRGSSPYDAGMFYCPYVPLQMVRAVGEDTFQPKIGFKTRYGLVNNPFVSGNGVGAQANKSDPHSANAIRCNQYYRIFRVDSIHGAV